MHHYPPCITILSSFRAVDQQNHLAQTRAAMMLPALRIALEKCVAPHRANHAVAPVVRSSAPTLAVRAQYWSRMSTATLPEKLHALSGVSLEGVGVCGGAVGNVVLVLVPFF